MRITPRLTICLVIALRVFTLGGELPKPLSGQQTDPAVRFPANRSFVRFPFQLLANAVFIPVTVNGKGPFLFYVDTGASDAIVASEFAAELNLHVKGMGSSMGAGSDSYEMGNVAGTVDFGLPGGLSVSTVQAVTISMAGTWPTIGQRVYGNIGREVLRHFVVEFDYEHQMITFYDPAQYRYTGSGMRFPAGVRGQVIVPGAAPIASQMSIDTGAGGTIITAPIVAKHHLLTKIKRKIPSPSHGVGNGVSDDVVGRVTQLRVGRYALDGPLLALSQDTQGSLAHDSFVNVGGNLLRRFTLTIDYPHKEVILAPNSHFSDPFLSDASGLVLEASGSDLRTFVVKGIVDGSPAEVSGIKTGDTIVEIDGRPATAVALWELQDLLKESGATRSLMVKRGANTLTIRISLRALA